MSYLIYGSNTSCGHNSVSLVRYQIIDYSESSKTVVGWAVFFIIMNRSFPITESKKTFRYNNSSTAQRSSLFA